MASKKQHAAIDFQGAAKITVGGSAGSSGQVLTSGGSGAMTWTAKSSGGVTKVVQTITGNGSATDFAITHSLGTYDIVVSVRYAADPFNDNSGASPDDIEDIFDYSYYTQADVGYNGTGGVEVATWNWAQHQLSTDQITLRFNPAPLNGHVYRVTIIG
jgi:hypothetical protein